MHSHSTSISWRLALFVSSTVLSAGLHAAPLSAGDQAFFIKAAQGGATEITASKSAEAKAASPEVKTFASTMIKDHTAVADELKSLAEKKGINLPSQPSTAQQVKIDALSKLTAHGFDQRYASDIGVAEHEATVALFEKTAVDAKDPDVKAFAAKTLPGLKHHLEMAKTLKASTDKS